MKIAPFLCVCDEQKKVCVGAHLHRNLCSENAPCCIVAQCSNAFYIIISLSLIVMRLNICAHIVLFLSGVALAADCTANSCSACTQIKGCGWCSATRQCTEGTAEKPNSGFCEGLGQWHFDSVILRQFRFPPSNVHFFLIQCFSAHLAQSIIIIAVLVRF